MSSGKHLKVSPQLLRKKTSEATEAEIEARKERFKPMCFLQRADKLCYGELLDELCKSVHREKNE